MPLSNIGIMSGATGFTVTGGTLKSFTPDGQVVVNGVHVACAATTDFRVRENITLKNRNPVRQPDGSYSKAKRHITLNVPLLKADGTIVINRYRYESEEDPETSAATCKNNRFMLTQLTFDADCEDFHVSGSTL